MSRHREFHTRTNGQDFSVANVKLGANYLIFDALIQAQFITSLSRNRDTKSMAVTQSNSYYV